MDGQTYRRTDRERKDGADNYIPCHCQCQFSYKGSLNRQVVFKAGSTGNLSGPLIPTLSYMAIKLFKIIDI